MVKVLGGIKEIANVSPKKGLDNGAIEPIRCRRDMTKSPLITVLLAALLISALASVGFCWAYIGRAMELRGLQYQLADVQNKRTFVFGLAKEASDYSEKNPDIDPILQAAGVKPPKAAASPSSNKSTAK
jgi:hypothetical protein